MENFKKTAIYWWIFDIVLQIGILLLQILTLPNFVGNIIHSNLGNLILGIVGLIATIWINFETHLKLYLIVVGILLLLYIFGAGFFVGQLSK